MQRLSKPIYPDGFTYLVAEVADTAMKAIRQADPYDYVENSATAETLQLARMRRGLTPQEYNDPVQRRQFRLDVVRTKLVRDLALHFIAAFQHYDRLRAATVVNPPAPSPRVPQKALVA